MRWASLIFAMLAAAAYGQGVQDLMPHLPTVADEQVNAAMHSPSIAYTRHEMRPTYQQDSNLDGRAAFIDVMYVIGPDPKGFGNGNRERPWGPGGGMPEGATTLITIRLPDGLPIAYWKEPARKYLGPNFSVEKLRWRFPVGTIICEVAYLDPQTPFLVRCKTREATSWSGRSFRPIKDHDHFVELTGYDQPVPVVTQEFHDGQPQKVAFRVAARAAQLPPIAADTLRGLLARPFQEVTETKWHEQAEDVVGGFVPRGYAGSLVHDRCDDCHRDVGMHVSAFDTPRDWYGFIRGDDGIFSFHPIDTSSISTNGAERQTVLKPGFVEAGLLKPLPQLPREHYQPLEGI